MKKACSAVRMEKS